MQLCLRQLWFEASVYEFELTACHIPGVHNVFAVRRFISSGYIFQASASQLGRKYTFNDIPKDYFQFQVDLIPYFYLTRLYNFFSNRAFVRFYVLEGHQLLDGFTTKLIRTDGSRNFHAQEYAVTF